MAKAKGIYTGVDSYGRSVEVAQRVDGVFFFRQYGWNGFGNTWSKWQKVETEINHPAQVQCLSEYAGAPDYVEIAEEDRHLRIAWGFNILRLAGTTPRVRLPE